MNPQQQQGGPSTPQRVFPQQAMAQGRPIVMANQQYTNRSFSPHTPSQQTPQQHQQQPQLQPAQPQLIRTPNQLMQQQTKQNSTPQG
jgi:hypothetical protein